MHWLSLFRDPYHWLLTLSWRDFFLAISLAYMGLNLLFGLAYYLGGDCIANAKPGVFSDYFFFSVQTLASIGYGAMYPGNFYANSLVTFESLIGLTGIALITGLAFARFSKPTARVMFSNVAVISNHDDQPTLMFRAANQRVNQILEAKIHCYLFRDEITREGKHMRRIHDLKLERDQTPNFKLSWTIMHKIDERSPIYGLATEELQRANTTLTVIISGIDETLSQTVHARHVYSHADILCGKQFADIIFHADNGDRFIDYRYFHDVE